MALLAWSGVEAARHAQTGDFSGFYQWWYLISHGTLNPPGLFQAQAILIEWPLAALGFIWPHPITLLVVQDFAIVGAEFVAFMWLCDLVAERPEVPAARFCLTGLALLVLDPWIYWSASWDYHSEPLGTLFAVLAARDLFRGRRIAVLWCALTLASGLVTTPYLVGVGISILFVRGRRVWGAAAIAAGTAWFELMLKLGVGFGIAGAVGKGHQAAGLLASRVPAAISALQHFWLDAIANLAPAGILGAVTAPAIGITAVVMGENFSQGIVGYVRPSFQGLPLYIFVPIGTILALMWLRRRISRRLADALVALSIVNVLGWAVLWIPQVVPTWLRVSPRQSEALTHIEQIIPERDGVVASQGIAGDFAGRKYENLFVSTPDYFRLTAPDTWFVIAPYSGIETALVAQSTQVIATLARDRNAKLAYVSDDVWAFRVKVPATGIHYLPVGEPANSYPAGLFATYGTAVRRGPERFWYMKGSDRAHGPILWGDYYLKSVGHYRTTVRLAGSGEAQVQLWNVTTNRELAEKNVALSGRATVSLAGSITRRDPKRSQAALRGGGPFQINPVPAYPGNNLETRVYAESASTIKVLHVSLTPAK
ncbi:DUF2079 domain-containing protein [Conexibacter sp. S30A1]|uniref:DUF2079 domain-containing protein n=1 Tax=Conexibacter sp. S30A1 TaxID=2937800 RepID=UPI00200FB195|nr:DUF2079 domain-containing protein [Conexibacter sp. S30A1]